MSLAIFVSATATLRSPADASASAPCPPWWIIGLTVGRSGSPVSSARAAITAGANPDGALMPVPTAVPPSGSSPSASTSACDRVNARASSPAQASASWPSVTGMASMRCVRPALTTPAKRSASRRKASIRPATAGWTSSTSWRPTAMRMAAGTVSFEDCDALTWSLGCTSRPSDADARLASTSLTFMFVDVPDPVWKTSMGNCSSCSPASTAPRRGGDRLGHVVVDAGDAELGVHGRGVPLDRGQRVGDAHVERVAGDREVGDRQVGLLPPQDFSHAFTLRTAARPRVPLRTGVHCGGHGLPRSCGRRRLGRLSGCPVRSGRCAHPDRRHPPPRVDEMFDEFLVPRGMVPFSEDDYLAHVDGRPRFDGVRTFLASRRIVLPEGDESDPPGDGSVAALGNRKNELFQQLLRDEGIAPYAGSVRLLDDLAASRHEDGGGLVVAQRHAKSSTRRARAPVPRGRRRRRRRRTGHRRQAGAGPVPGCRP